MEPTEQPGDTLLFPDHGLVFCRLSYEKTAEIPIESFFARCQLAETGLILTSNVSIFTLDREAGESRYSPEIRRKLRDNVSIFTRCGRGAAGGGF